MGLDLESIFGPGAGASSGSSGGGLDLEGIFGNSANTESDIERKRLKALEKLQAALSEKYPDLDLETARSKFAAEGAPEKESLLERGGGALGLGALEASAPAMAALGTFGATIGPATAASAWMGPAAPIGGFLGAGAASVGAAWLTAKAREKASETYQPGTAETAAEVAAEHPNWHLAGNLSTALMGGVPSLTASLAQRGAGAAGGTALAAMGPILTEHRAPTLEELAWGAGLGFAMGPHKGKYGKWVGEYTGPNEAYATKAKAAKLAEAIAAKTEWEKLNGLIPEVQLDAKGKPVLGADGKPIPTKDWRQPLPEETEVALADRRAAVAEQLDGSRVALEVPPALATRPEPWTLQAPEVAAPREAPMEPTRIEPWQLQEQPPTPEQLRNWRKANTAWQQIGEMIPVEPKPPGEAMALAKMRAGRTGLDPTSHLDRMYDAGTFSSFGGDVLGRGLAKGWRALMDPAGLNKPKTAPEALNDLSRRMGVPTTPPPEPGSPTEKLIGAIKTATVDRRAQDLLIHEARQGQAAKLGQIKSGGEETVGAVRQALSGALPKVAMEPVRPQFTQPEVDMLFKQVWDSPTVRGRFDKGNTIIALDNLLRGGRVPQPAEIANLERVFGPELAEALMHHGKPGAKLWGLGLDAWNTSRALVTSLDMSAPLRQGLLLSTSHPVMAAKAAKGMVRSFMSENAYRAIENDIFSRPNAKLYEDTGLFMADRLISGPREEAYVGRGNLLKRLPVIGEFLDAQVLGRSERAYNAYLNKMRADVFDHLAAQMQQSVGPPGQNPRAYQQLAEYINISTGRGGLGPLERVSTELASVLFAPRLISARLQTLASPLRMHAMPKPVRVEAMRGLLATGAAGLTFLALAKWAGAKVETDMRSADFGKAKFGQTRIDPWGGFQQYGKFVAQMLSNERKTASGAIEPLNRKETLYRFAEGKMQPMVGLIRDILAGQGFVGQSLEAEKMLAERTVPLFLQDAYDAIGDHGAAAGLALALPSFFGAGVQTYGEPIPEDRMVKTPLENAVHNFAAGHVGKAQTQDQKEVSAVMRQAESAIRAGADPAQILEGPLAKGILTPKQADGLMQRAKLDPWTVKFKMLSLKEAEEAYKVARPAEKAKYGPLLAYKRTATAANELFAQKRNWKTYGVGKPLTAEQGAELKRMMADLAAERRRKKVAEQAQRLARAYEEMPLAQVE